MHVISHLMQPPIWFLHWMGSLSGTLLSFLVPFLNSIHCPFLLYFTKLVVTLVLTPTYFWPIFTLTLTCTLQVFSFSVLAISSPGSLSSSPFSHLALLALAQWLCGEAPLPRSPRASLAEAFPIESSTGVLGTGLSCLWVPRPPLHLSFLAHPW